MSMSCGDHSANADQPYVSCTKTDGMLQDTDVTDRGPVEFEQEMQVL